MYVRSSANSDTCVCRVGALFTSGTGSVLAEKSNCGVEAGVRGAARVTGTVEGNMKAEGGRDVTEVDVACAGC